MAEADNVGLGHKIEMSSPNLSMNFRGFLLKAKLHFDQSILIVSWPSWHGGNVSIHPLVTCKQSKTFKEQNMAGWDGNTNTLLTFDSSCATSSSTSLWACSSCWGLARSRSVLKFWSSQGARWCRASRGKWSPEHNEWLLIFYMIQ